MVVCLLDFTRHTVIVKLLLFTCMWLCYAALPFLLRVNYNFYFASHNCHDGTASSLTYDYEMLTVVSTPDIYPVLSLV